jgi:hypothetical protein
LKMGRKQAPRNRKYNCLLTGTAWDGAIGDTLPRCVWLGTKTCCTKELATLGWVWMVLKFRIYSACNGPGVSWVSGLREFTFFSPSHILSLQWRGALF